MKSILSLIVLLILTNFPSSAQTPVFLKGFSILPPFDEQVKTFNYYADVRVQINAPSPETFDPAKPCAIALFGTPNGSTLEQTFGRRVKPDDDWLFDIQHIGAQTRFIRQNFEDYNLITIILQPTQKSWPTWRSEHSDNAVLIGKMIDSLKNIFNEYNPFIVLTGHSGGGSMTFGYLNGVDEIPDKIKRISFLDSNYGYDNSYGPKFLNWLNASGDHYLSVIAYNDSVALLNGSPVVSPTGGTWYRSRLMQNYLKDYMQFTTEENDQFIKYTALNGRVKFILKKNPLQKIFHTVQVELNGFIQGMVSGTSNEGSGYVYYGPRSYSEYIQGAIYQFSDLTIPPRPANAKSGSEFMQYVTNMTFEEREDAILSEITKGNIPEFIRSLRTIRSNFLDINGRSYKCYFQVMPDYLAIGSDVDYCRIPMGPKTAQTIANLFGSVMPTPKLVDDIYKNAELKVAPVTYTPVGNQNELVAKFIEHNTAIEQQRITAGKQTGVFMGGTKKDVVLSNKIIDPSKPNHVVIYGWHKLDGTPIQPVYNGHISSYVDYSHGIRLLNKEIILDTVMTTITDILRDSLKYRILSNESGPMVQPSYFNEAFVPLQPRSFGIKAESKTSLRLVIKPDTSVKTYKVKIGKDGKNFGKTYYLQPENTVISNLQTDSLFYIRVIASNTKGDSPVSEVLAGIPSAESPLLLIVNGFDRTSAGNTQDFIRQHASAFHQNGIKRICTATNDAVIDGLFQLTDFAAADYILGDESTVDETFSTAEQKKITEYLKNGGNLFISCSEIAWDLDYKGNALDKSFVNNYLKLKYADDAPNGQSGIYYKAESVNSSIINIAESFSFDNGTQGTINVKWPDVIKPVNGGIGLLKYSGLDTSSGYAGISYQGIFATGTKPSKLIVFGFPFETIYPQSKSREIAKNIIDFFDISTSAEVYEPSQIADYRLWQNFPNPFNPVTTIRYELPVSGFVSLKVFDILGKEAALLVNEEQEPGLHTIDFNAGALSGGVYIYQLTCGQFTSSKKLLLLK